MASDRPPTALVTAALLVALASLAGSACQKAAGTTATGRSNQSVAKQSVAKQSVPAPPMPPPTLPAEQAMDVCLKVFDGVTRCFADDRFWEIFVTTYYAAKGHPAVTPEEKQGLIGLKKDDVAQLVRDKAAKENCQLMVSRNKRPNRAQADRYLAAAGLDCAELGAATGKLLFVDGVFHLEAKP